MHCEQNVVPTYSGSSALDVVVAPWELSIRHFCVQSQSHIWNGEPKEGRKERKNEIIRKKSSVGVGTLLWVGGCGSYSYYIAISSIGNHQQQTFLIMTEPSLLVSKSANRNVQIFVCGSAFSQEEEFPE